MSNEEKAPLRFWIGLHKEGGARDCIVDFDGGPMDGVKAAWSAKNEKTGIVMETVIQPELSGEALGYLELLTMMERRVGDPRLPSLETLLREVAMSAYEAGMRNAALRPKRP